MDDIDIATQYALALQDSGIHPRPDPYFRRWAKENRLFEGPFANKDDIDETTPGAFVCNATVRINSAELKRLLKEHEEEARAISARVQPKLTISQAIEAGYLCPVAPIPMPMPATAAALVWNPIRGWSEDGAASAEYVPTPTPYVPPAPAEEPKATVDSVINKFGDGKTQIEYRWAAAWRRGVVIGRVVMGGVDQVVVKVNTPDEDVAYNASKGSKWFMIIDMALATGDRLIPIDTKFVMIAPDQIREIVPAKSMPERPHKCPRCGARALIMTTKVSCSDWTCKNYDKWYHKDSGWI